MKSTLQKALCLMLAVVVLSMSLSVFAVDPVPTETPQPDEGLPNANEALITYYIWKTMQAWGIDISYGETGEFTEEVDQFLLQSIADYLTSQPSIGGWGKWILPWSFQFDLWGNLQANNNFLEDVQDFVDWFCTSLGIYSNSSVVVGGVSVISNIEVYQLPIYGFRITNNAPSELIEFTYSGNSPYNGDVYVAITQRNPLKVIWIGTENGTIVGQTRVVNGSSLFESQFSLYTNEVSGYNPFNYYVFPMSWPTRNQSSGIYVGEQYKVYSESQVWAALQGESITTGGGIEVISGEIITPDNDPTYHSGDSITIVEGDPVYITIEWPDSIKVNNLPAVISPTDITDPDLNSAYQEITPFFRTMESGLDVVRGLILRLPVEVLSCLFALMGAMIIFGILKIMREH